MLVKHSKNWGKNNTASLLLLLFFVVSLLEIISEFNGNKTAVWITKPLILPILLTYYLKRSKKISIPFTLALSCSWIANLLFIENTFQYIVYGVAFYLIYRILVIYIIVNKVKMPSLIPLILGSIPFLFIYVSVTIFTYHILGKSVYLFLLQGIFTVFLGGFSLGNYIMVSNRLNSLLFVSTMLLTLNQFVFLLKFFYSSINELQALAMVLFVIGQFLLTKYMFHTEKYKQKFEIMGMLKEID